ncbi:hypothetical protein Rcae01_00070 [Novipirellula caenicola]|uniref:Uncharacterized protein n=1 Tax=Novipirellula caenicola TaxID=1536901 RepID=A0ABP9VHE3_9BACT
MRLPKVAFSLTTILLLAAVSSPWILPLAFAENPIPAKEVAKTYPVTYRTADLPVWTKDGKWSPELLMTLIQSAISPTSWEAAGGTSAMAPYPQNSSIVILTTSENHDELQSLLNRFRN